MSKTPDAVLLSERQINVLQAMSDASSVRAAAVSLDIAESTVNSHLANIRRTLKVHTTCQAISWGFRNGVLK